MTPREGLDRGLDELALQLPEEGRAKLMQYVALLQKWNRVYNLTAVREPLEMVSHHLIDSLAVLPHLPVGPDAALADVGSGAGLPGIPLALARPQWRIALVESSEKKAAFLRQAALELGLHNIEVHAGRAESWHPRALFDVVISRAFAQLSKFVALCAHLVAPGGILAAMKAGYPEGELAEVPAGWRCRTVRMPSPLLGAERHLVLCSA
jgi:16S rRNA (guanine527-N7)-methyltransferase